jgi:virginiamycin A acetyltransferase
MKQALKQLLNLFCQLLVLPLVVLCKLEEIVFSRNTEIIFQICTHLVALLPGLPGVFLRRAFYSLTLDECSSHCHIGFGTIFSHRFTTVEKHVYIGSYSIIGSAHLGEHCLIGSRVSILSGKALHVLGDDGMWTPYSPERLSQIKLDKNVWIGEGAIIAADVGEGSMVGSGAVVTSNIRSHVIVTGNPARFVKKLDDKE